ncbi:MAG: hypothetical protein JJU02_11290 [Cryomorphaceae bacterium]|nr:hypothetical protein [Cryomorphaceae bacterium]
MLAILFQFHWIWFFIGLTIIFALVWTVYGRSSGFFSSRQRLFLGTLRFLALLILLILLMKPQLRRIVQEPEKPIVIVGVDQSRSMTINMDSTELHQSVNDFSQSLKSRWGKVFDFDFVGFHSDVFPLESMDFNGKETNISRVLDYGMSRYPESRMRGLVLLTDGIYTTGVAPGNMTFTRPIFPLVYGDTVQRADASIERVVHNRFVYRGNAFEVEADLSFEGLSGENVVINMHREGVLVDRQTFTLGPIPTQLKNLKLRLPPVDKSGLVAYELEIEPVGNERFLENNRYPFYVEVLQSKKRVVIFGSAPHPDIGALRSAIMGMDHYEVEVVFGSDISSFDKDFDVAILHDINLPAARMQQLEDARIGTLQIIGAKSSVKNLQGTFNFSGLGGSFERARPGFNTNFTYFNIDSWWRENGKNLPPLLMFHPRVLKGSQSEVIAHASIEGIQTERILLGAGYRNNIPHVLVNGTGLWQWRMSVFRERESHDIFDDMVSQMLRFIGSVPKQERLQLYHAKRFSEGRAVRIDARLYDASFAPTTTGAVKIRIFSNEQERFQYDFTPRGIQYYLEVKGLEPGVYTYIAESKLGAEKHQVEGTFVVEDFQAEFVSTRANMSGMITVANQSGGEVFYHTEVDQLLEALSTIETRPILRERIKLTPLIDLWILFVILLTLLSAEWFIRRRAGSY